MLSLVPKLYIIIVKGNLTAMMLVMFNRIFLFFKIYGLFSK